MKKRAKKKREREADSGAAVSAASLSAHDQCLSNMKRTIGEIEDPNMRTLFPKQEAVAASRTKRKIVRAGRRGGKTVGAATISVRAFLAGKRVLYAVPTTDQLSTWWFEVTLALHELIDAGVYKKNETEHTIERLGTKQRIKGKTAWNADSLRGDYGDLLILDEWQLMDEDAWDRVGAPMLLDNNGDAIFIYTPPSIHSRSVSKARDPMHAANMFKDAEKEMELATAESRTPRWEAFHWSSHDNPHISDEALKGVTSDMTALAYRQEILAEDSLETPGALWTLTLIDQGAFDKSGRRLGGGRVVKAPDLFRVGVGVDPPGGATECGIVAAGLGRCNCKGVEETHGFVVADRSLKASPNVWGAEAVSCYEKEKAGCIYGEQNFGGDMVEFTIRTVSPRVSYRNVHASRGKAIRAEPIAAQYEQGRIHHVGMLPGLEAEMISWVPGLSKRSPNRIDALVWVLTELTEFLTHEASGPGPELSASRPVFAGVMTETI